jgi:iron complex transport system permease protein
VALVERATSIAATRSPSVGGHVLRRGRWSIRVDPRSVVVGTVLALLIVIVGCWSISVGDFPVPMRDVIRSLLGDGGDDAEFIVQTLRLPRVLTGIMVGMALAVAGAIFQSLANNPLASPDVIGFDSGAALGAVFMIVIVGGGSLEVSVGAVAGGFATALAVYLLAYKKGIQGYRLILVGLGIGYAVSAVNDYLITRANIYDVQRAVVWLTGSLNGRGWQHVRPVGAGLVVLLPIALMLLRRLRLLELGVDTATALGVNVGRTRLALIAVAVGLAALATASAGPIGFVALVSPPITRRLVRSPGATLLPAALFGGLLTVSADLAARRVLAPTELPVGIMTAIVGAPYLLWLLSREIRTGSM